jgi:adenylate cyclase
VRALEATELLRADYSDLTEYFETMPQVAPRFVELVDRRRRENERRVRQQARAGRQGAAHLNHLLPILELDDTRRLLGGMETLVDRLVRAAAKLTDADRSLLFLVDETTGEIWTRAPERTGSAEIRLPRGSGIAGWVIANNELANLDDAAADERFNPEIDERTGSKSQTLLCAPVAHEGRVIGALQVINKSIGAFDEQDEALLRALAEHIGHAAGGLPDLRRFAKNYDTVTRLLDIATLVAESRNRETLFERLCARVAELLDCERCDCFLLDYAKDALWIRRQEGPTKIVRLPLRALPAGYTASTGRLINIADVSNDFRFNPQIEKYLGVKIRNLLSAPLLNRKRGIVAVLQAVNKRDGVFDNTDEELLRAVTNQVGTSALINT